MRLNRSVLWVIASAGGSGVQAAAAHCCACAASRRPGRARDSGCCAQAASRTSLRLTGGVGTGASQPAIRLGAWAWSVVGFVLGNVDRHVLQHLADVLVRDAVEDVLGLAFAAHEARAAQQAQVMADQGLRQV